MGFPANYMTNRITLFLIWGMVLMGCNASASLEEGGSSPAIPNLNAVRVETSMLDATDPWQHALKRAATVQGHVQQSQVDWAAVVVGWQDAIALLESVPPDHPHYGDAQAKLAEYEGNLTAAQRLAKQPQSSPVEPDAESEPGLTEADDGPKLSPPWSPRSAKVALANHLQETGAIMYGAYWCVYCKRQRQLFGTKAFQYVTEVECDPRGENPQPELCHQVGVEAYPSWEINGQLHRGSRSLETLANLSGYDGPRNF